MKNNSKKIISLTILFILMASINAHAVVEFDQNITPDTIFGTGNANGQFTTNRLNGIEVGIRAKLPGNPMINSNGDGSYSYTLVETATTGNNWNFDFTINVNYDNSNILFLNGYTYEVGMDANAGVATDYLSFDPITPGATTPDHSIGNNMTANGAGTEAADAASYLVLLATNNVLQQSWRYAFFSGIPPLTTYDPLTDGQYTVYIEVRNLIGIVLVRTEIQVIIGNGLPVELINFSVD